MCKDCDLADRLCCVFQQVFEEQEPEVDVIDSDCQLVWWLQKSLPGTGTSVKRDVYTLVLRLAPLVLRTTVPTFRN